MLAFPLRVTKWRERNESQPGGLLERERDRTAVRQVAHEVRRMRWYLFEFFMIARAKHVVPMRTYLIARAAKYQRSVVSVGEEKEKSDHMPRNSRFAAASADLISSNS